VFGGKQKREQAEEQLEQVVERLKSLSAEQIGVELIENVDPGGLDPQAIPVGALAKCLSPGYGRLRGPEVEAFLALVDEGCSALEQAGLFTSVGWGGVADGNVYALSRKGREALDARSVSQILGETS
jgi:hypothetical protein